MIRKRRVKPKPLQGDDAFAAAQAAVAEVLDQDPTAPLSDATGAPVGPQEFFEAARVATVPYRTAAGFVSRKTLPDDQRHAIRSGLFRVRSVLDTRLEKTIEHHVRTGATSVRDLLKHRLFGYCKKQGVSLRLSLNTCVPTPLCGGACYAHDGRERVTATILSGCYTTAICRLWEQGEIPSDLLMPHVRRGVQLAREDAAFSAAEYGFQRRARIRLAHVGEVVAFPRFANWVAAAIRAESGGTVDSVVYTRHPGVESLDVDQIVVNLTLDRASDSRRKWLRRGVRLVWSAWDGTLDPAAEVNFLEHHEFTHSAPKGKGPICPATTADTEKRFCDAFGCSKCFEHPLVKLPRSRKATVAASDHVKTRTFGLMRRTVHGED